MLCGKAPFDRVGVRKVDERGARRLWRIRVNVILDRDVCELYILFEKQLCDASNDCGDDSLVAVFEDLKLQVTRGDTGLWARAGRAG